MSRYSDIKGKIKTSEWHLCFTVCAISAHKMLQDVAYSMRYYSKLFEIDIYFLLDSEIELHKIFGFDMRISRETYIKTFPKRYTKDKVLCFTNATSILDSTL